MQANTDALLTAVNKDDPRDFIAMIKSQNGSCPSIDLSDVLLAMNHSQHESLWHDLQILFKKHSKVSNEVDLKTTTAKVLDCVISLVSLYTEQNKATIFEDLINLVADMHECLLLWPGELDKLKYRVVQLGENWFKMGFPRKTAFSLYIFLFLLRCTTSKKPKKVDIKRLWTMRNCIKTLDIASAILTEIKTLLITASTTPIFLSCDEGIKFLSSLFEFNDVFVNELHAAIKSHLPTCNHQQSNAYGDIYFRAWKEAKGALKETIEVDCIQDLMFHAINIDPIKSKTLINNLRKLLSYIHSQKQIQPDVREMLLRLYEPFLWRSLKVANGYVRANAALIFFDAFPLEDAKMSNEELEALLEMQYQLAKTLLMDEYPVVRTFAVYGACHICNVYWEMIPSNTIAEILKIITEQHAYDVSSANTRMTVFKGLSSLVQNPLTHTMLEKLLPQLSSCIYDNSEKVRLAVVELLLNVKSQRGIKYWDIVPPVDLLARLEVDTDPVCRRIVSLIFSNYHPTDKSDEELLQRSMALIRDNRQASRKFYQHAHKYMGVNDTVKFLLLATRFAHYYASKVPLEEKTASSGESSADTDDGETENVDDDTNFPTTDFNVICGLLDAVCVLWTGIHSQLTNEHNTTLRKNLEKQTAKAMRLFGRAYKGTAAFQSVLCMASLIPANKVHLISGHCISCLKSMEPNSPVSEYGVILTSLCNWGMADTVLELLSEWISSALPSETSSVKFYRQRSKKVKFCEPRTPQPMLALQFLKYVLKSPPCRKNILARCRNELTDILNVAKNTMTFLEKRFSTETFECEASDELLVNMFQSYCQLSVHMNNKQEDVGEFSTVETMKDVFLWVEKIALPHLLPSSKKLNGGRKRKTSVAHSFDKPKASFDVLQTTLNVAHDMFLCSIASEEFAAHSLYLCNKILAKGNGYVLVIEVIKLLHQLLCYSVVYKIAQSLCLDELPNTVCAALRALLKYSSVKNDQELEVFRELRPVLRTILTSYFDLKHLHLVHSILANVFAAAVSEVSLCIKNEDSLKTCKDINHLPIFSSTLLNAISGNNGLIRIFVTEALQLLRADAIDEITKCIAIGHIFVAFRKETQKAKVDLNDLVAALEKCVLDLKKSTCDDDAHLEDAKQVMEELKKK